MPIKNKRFYVYEWFIVDTFEIFYVGKGTGNRRFETHNRNKYFMNIYNKYNCAVRIYKQNLTNGGTGFSTGSLNPTVQNPHYGEKNGMRKHNIDFSGEKNPFYNKKHTEKTKEKISNSRKGKGGRSGKENPMYGSDKLRGKKNGMYGMKGFKHPNSKMYQITYSDAKIEILTYKECEKKFGIAFSRIYKDGGILHYKKRTPNSIYEGLEVKRVK